MKESVPYIDEWVLIDIGVPHPVRPAIVVQGDVVVVDITLVLRHCAPAERFRGKL